MKIGRIKIKEETLRTIKLLFPLAPFFGGEIYSCGHSVWSVAWREMSERSVASFTNMV